MKTPATCPELFEAANLPFNEGNGLISRADKALVVQCFTKIYSNFGNGYLHSSDHYAALKVLLEREPTFREVYDSYHGGSRNIDAARVKMGKGERPTGWDSWTDGQRLYSVLVELNGITRGSKILDRKMKDPAPDKTAALLAAWGGKPLPEEPEKPIDKPVDKPPSGLSPAGLRAEEIWSVGRPLVRLLVMHFPTGAQTPDPKVDQLWLVAKPLLVLLIETWRRRNALAPIVLLMLLSGCAAIPMPCRAPQWDPGDPAEAEDIVLWSAIEWAGQEDDRYATAPCGGRGKASCEAVAAYIRELGGEIVATPRCAVIWSSAEAQP